jgi:PAS domain S-box-containing protein
MIVDSPSASAGAAVNEHSVRFYEKDDALMAEVTDHLDAALRAGGTAIAIATAPHRAELTRRLAGINGPASSQGQWFPGQLVMLDAQETLAHFTVAGKLVAEKFREAVEPLVRSVDPGRPVHAFGEMVALLCEGGDYEGALQLEGLWNDLARKHSFALFCAYPRRLFASKDKVQAFQHVCAAHSVVLNLLTEAPAADAQGDVTRMREQALALQAEVERRRKAEQTLRKREQELAEFLDRASVGIHKVGADGTILYANHAELQMLGYEWGEYVGHNIVEFYFDESHARNILQRLGRGDVLDDEPAVMRCKDGSRKHVCIHSNGYFEEGQLRYTRCFTRDDSERVARDQAIQQRNNLILHAPMGAVLVSSPHLRYELANDEFCRMFGCEDVVGRTFGDVFPPLAGSEIERSLREVFRTGQPYSTDEYRTRVALGGNSPEERFFHIRLQPLAEPGAQVHSVIGITLDITQQVRAQHALQQSYRDREQLLESLAEANRAKDEFLAMLGHELRNPLSPIVTALQLMRMRGDSETAREQAIIQRQVDHMVRLVDDLLDISRITRGKLELKRSPVDISEIVTKAVEQASPLLEQRSHHLAMRIEPGLRCEVDPVRMAQVIANLLTNAARYTNTGGRIRVTAWRAPDGRIAISVRDNGRGITPEMLGRVFELFYQGERSVDRAEGGLGIGLALVRSIVELHGGTVAASSDGEGMGSEFVVNLPASTKQRAANEPRPAQPPSVAPRRRILLVDDNLDAAETLAEWLNTLGHEVSVHCDPVSALKALEQVQPDVAVLDIGLPVMDGYELGSRIRAVSGDACTMIALTGYGQEADKARSRLARFDYHLVKPVDPMELQRILELDAGALAGGFSAS